MTGSVQISNGGLWKPALTAAVTVTLCVIIIINSAYAERIKDLASIEGVRTNQLVGYGLVVGLDGTGDQTSQAPFTLQSLKSMLAQFGINLPANVNPQLKNVAAVSIHGELPAFIKRGQTIDITVSSIGNAKSLRGGSLLLTPLKGIDGNVYAIAQGNVVVGGLGISGSDGSKISINIPSAGLIPNGATVEREVPNGFNQGDSIMLNLHSPDFTTSERLSSVINKTMGINTATPIDGTSIRVSVPQDSAERVAFISALENLTLTPGDAAARIIINARTGTVVIGQHVSVTEAAVTHGNLTVRITETPLVSQPSAFSKGTTTIVPRSDIDIKEDMSRMFLFNPGVALGDIVRAINEVGASPGDLISILQALKQAGALRAELIVI